jgi:arylsulfatase A-like enzyme
MDSRDLEHIVALYDGEIRYTDAYVGRLVTSLARRRLLDDTVVVVTSDHGEEFFEHGNKGHRKTLYDESIRVPLIVRYPPRVPAGTVVERQVRLMDVAPTILALTAVPSPPDFGVEPLLADYAGRSLVPLMTNATAAAPMPPAFASLDPWGQRALRGERHKLMLMPLTPPTERLFDLVSDPREQTNLVATEPTTAAALRSELDAWTSTTRRVAKQSAPAAMSEQHKAALRALGYVE